MQLRYIATSLVAAATAIAGCASSTPNYDQRFGDAVRQSRQSMAINPTPAPQPAAMDGKAAKEAIGRYQDSFKTPPPAINVINLSGSGTN